MHDIFYMNNKIRRVLSKYDGLTNKLCYSNHFRYNEFDRNQLNNNLPHSWSFVFKLTLTFIYHSMYQHNKTKGRCFSHLTYNYYYDTIMNFLFSYYPVLNTSIHTHILTVANSHTHTTNKTVAKDHHRKIE